MRLKRTDNWMNLQAMKLLATYLCVVLLAGCNQQKPKFTEEQMEAIHADAPGMTDACLEKLRWGGVEAMPERSDQCYTFEKPRKWKGVWLNQFEGSTFCPAGSQCSHELADYPQQIWLEFASPRPDKAEVGAVYEVEFIGRRSIGKGNFGHMGVSENDIIVDRIISMKELQPPPPEPTKAQVIADWKKCEAEHSCIPNWPMINSIKE